MTPLSSPAVLQAFLNRTPADLAFRSQEFARALIADFRALTDDPADADTLFSSLGIPALFAESAESQILVWERVLRMLRGADPARYEAIHKGTAFYFLGVASYLGEDFERALFYMDCALEQDHRLHEGRWHRVPSGMFVRLDDAPEAQFARELVRVTRGLFEAWGKKVTAAGGTALPLRSYRTRLVNRAVEEDPPMRSAVTALLSFVLEIRPRQTQLALAPTRSGTGEPFFLHLFKGGLLFETVLRASRQARASLEPDGRSTLGELLALPAVSTRLALPAAPQGLRAESFEDAVARIHADASSGRSFDERAVRAAWALRNATGHNLAWPRRPSEAEYEELFLLVLGSIGLVVERLYPEHLLEDGTA